MLAIADTRLIYPTDSHSQMACQIQDKQILLFVTSIKIYSLMQDQDAFPKPSICHTADPSLTLAVHGDVIEIENFIINAQFLKFQNCTGTVQG